MSPRMDDLIMTETPARTGGDTSVSALVDLVSTHCSEYLARLTAGGGLLWRGWEVGSSADFERIVTNAEGEIRSYVGGNSPRTKVGENSYTSTEYPSKFEICLHQELSYELDPPSRLWFGALQPAPVGGATRLADARSVYRALNPDVRGRFERYGVRYVQRLHHGSGLGKSWQATFETDDRSNVEAYLRAQEAEFHWHDGGLEIVRVRPATRPHPATGDILWFNQVDQWHPVTLDAATRRAFDAIGGIDVLPHYATFGNSEPIDDRDLTAVLSAGGECAIDLEWQRGDVLAIDNFSLMHGRAAYGGDRQVLVALVR